jgi:hypothetical protein
MFECPRNSVDFSVSRMFGQFLGPLDSILDGSRLFFARMNQVTVELKMNYNKLKTKAL